MIACTQGLVNGGIAGLFWSYMWTFVGFTFVEMSLAEMASMCVARDPGLGVSLTCTQGTNVRRPISLGF